MAATPGPPPGTSRRHPSPVPVELALAGLMLAGVAGLARLFEDLTFLPLCAAFAVLGHGLAAACRRRAVGGAAGAGVAVLGVAAGVSWLALPGTTALGVPTPATLATALRRLGDGWALFTDVSAPAPAAAGLVLAGALAAYVVAWVADGAAFRADAPVEAAVPAASLFVFGAALGAPGYRLPSTLLFLAALLGYWLLARARGHERRSAAGSAEGTAPSVLASGGRLGLVAALAATVVGPLVPGAGADALLPWRASDRDDDTRVTVSPLVDLRARIVDQSDAEAFTVQSDARSYWRLTALDVFDGRVWRYQGQVQDVEDELGPPGSYRPAPGEVVVAQEFDIARLESIWLPAALRPVALDAGSADVGVDPVSSTVLTRDDSSDGLRYRVDSVDRDHSPETLKGGADWAEVAPVRIVTRFTDLPGDFSQRVRRVADDVVGTAPTPYDGARRLQDWFRDGRFRYDLDVDPGSGEDELERFLFDTRAGYCEQFAGAYAAMARAAGLPARIAVGFTPGELELDGRYHVRGVHGHAWPEVYLGAAGWVPFEPTPGRGIPRAEAYTGVAPDQAGPDGVGVTTTTAPPTTLPPLSTPSTPPGRFDDRLPETLPGSGAGAGGSPWPGRLAAGAAGLGAGAVLWAVAVGGALRWRRWRRRVAAAGTSERVLVAWQEVGEALARAGAGRRPAETPQEYAGRARAAVAGVDAARLAALAAAATEAGYAAAPIEEGRATAAVATAGAVERNVLGSLGRRSRLAAWLDPRPLLARRPRVDIRAGS